MHDINILITTFNRPDMLSNLLNGINKLKADYDIMIHIHNDGSTNDYSKIVQTYTPHLKIKYFHHEHHGKKGYWQLINKVFSNIATARYYIMLPDDDILKENFFDRIILEWNLIQDKDKICLMPSINEERKWIPCWTGKMPFKEGNVWNVGYMDMRFICETSMFKELGEIPPIPLSRWENDNVLSSGVGRKISILLDANGYNMYICDTDLTYQIPHEKKMNPLVKDRQI